MAFESTTYTNLVEKITRYESGLMEMEEAVEFFQFLIDTGLAWRLQGSYGRMAHDLITAGECHHGE
jgi:hypothetical protein